MKIAVYLDAEIYEMLRMRAAATRRSVSEIANEVLRVQLNEDLNDSSIYPGASGWKGSAIVVRGCYAWIKK